jgi:hypothetical protein
MNQFQRTAIDQIRSGASMLAVSEPREDMEFVRLLRAIGLAESEQSSALQFVERGSRAFDILQRSIVAGGGLSDPAWGSALASYAELSAGFVASLRSASFFDRVLADMVAVPLRTRIGVFTTGAVGTVTAAGTPIPVSRMTLTGSALETFRATALVVITNELLKHGSNSALRLLAKELRAAVAVATDTAFFSAVTSGAPSHASGGSTAALILADLNTMLGDVTIGAASKLYVGLSASNCAKLAMKLNTAGQSAFPGVGVTGGDVAGITVIPTDGLSTSAVLLDAAGVAAGDEIISIAAGSSATVEMSDTPVNTPLLTGSPQAPVPTSMVSMFQTDSTALRAIRYFGTQRFRAAASVLTSISW